MDFNKKNIKTDYKKVLLINILIKKNRKSIFQNFRREDIIFYILVKEKNFRNTFYNFLLSKK